MYVFGFRFIDGHGKPNGKPINGSMYYGVASAESKQALFNAIDEFGNPHAAQVRHIGAFSFCFFAERIPTDDGDLVETHEEEYGGDTYHELIDADDWKDVDWKSDEDWLASVFDELDCGLEAQYSDKNEMYWFEQAEKYHDKVVKLQKSNDSLIKSINALMAKVGHA